MQHACYTDIISWFEEVKWSLVVYTSEVQCEEEVKWSLVVYTSEVVSAP
jgi:hypothetical protein